MIIGDRKKIPTILVSKMSEGAEVEAPMKPEHSIGEHDQVLHSIAEDMLNAFHIKSAHALVSSFKAMFDALEMSPHEEYSDEE